MKFVSFVLLLIAALTGCAPNMVTVDSDSCVARGEVDGVKLLNCKRVQLK